MKKRWFAFMALLLMATPVKALYCSYENLAYYKKLASNVNVSYDYEEKDNTVIFTITILNLPPNFYIIDQTTGKQYSYQENEIKITGYPSGQKLQYKIYTTQNNCEQELLSTIHITLPTYNPFYKDAVCQDVIGYSLCNRWSSHGLEYDTFVKKVNQYKESLKKEDTPPPKVEEVPDNSIVQMFMRFLEKYYYIFLVIVIIISSIGIYRLNKKDNIYY